MDTIPDLPPRVSGRLKDGRATLMIDVTGLDPAQADALEAEARARVTGTAEVRVLRTSERTARRLVAVASGKGGVGKSTVSANLAVALARRGRKAGLVDADIYGPSQPRLLGADPVPPDARDNKMIPVATPAGVPLLSMGMLVPAGQAIAWRGPMAGNALGQLIDAHWGDVDPLILDLPPGTGDIQLTMVQKHKPVGAMIVSTPQDLALIDAARAIDLFNKAGVPIIGLVENMAGYACPHCGEVSDPFGSGGAEAEAARLGIDFLGRIPLSIAIRRDSDAGLPPAAGNGPDAAAFDAVAGAVDSWLRAHGG
ncbi:Mrp/NBP35 family ATP-binding protein [Sphingomonas sp.]|uniref:Mrp/NBP35 family ATP-binding protein n=1 Tax=Sphingomonas sp. TaxID=28214 RepID=UPI002CD43FEA|nr:Mrp/NBP35 family ATP-binding protein [Sphingomonas sp.]HWK35025.1 Mrp/NBP35 family ATP-binding protein [Sphingomonas sp.]